MSEKIVMEKTIVRMGASLCFGIIHYNEDNDTNEYFAGFFNEVECIGTEEECQCWEMEEWVDNQDAALFFSTPDEAKAWLANIDEEKQPNCKIMLYGYCEKTGFDGCHYFPLKEFKV